MSRSLGVLTQKRLCELVHYDPATGDFVWKIDRTGGVKAGSLAGYVNNEGYRMLRLDGRDYSAHRVAWLYRFGFWPLGEIDHINRDRADNRIANLRDVSRAVNQSNKGCWGKSGHAGVQLRDNGKYRAYISGGGKRRSLGTFETFEEAVAAYRTAHASIYGSESIYYKEAA